jgi:hypothetical protein
MTFLSHDVSRESTMRLYQIISDLVRSSRSCSLVYQSHFSVSSLQYMPCTLQIDASIPMSRSTSKRSSAAGLRRQKIGSTSLATVQLLFLALKIADDTLYIEAATSLFPEMTPELALLARSGVGIESVANEADKDAFSQLVTAVCALERIAGNCSSLEDIVVNALDIVTSTIGISGDAFDLAHDTLSQQEESFLSPSSQQEIAEKAGLDKIIEAARKIDKDFAESQFEDDVFVKAKKDTLVSAYSRDDDTDHQDSPFLALIARDVLRREAHHRSQMGLAVKRKTSDQKNVGGSEVRRREMMGKLAILVNRVREEFDIYSPTSQIPENKQDGPPGEDVVRFITIHKAKGSQFRFVILSGADCSSFPIEGGGMRDGLTGTIPRTFLDEERRIFYVGCTRAIDRLVISFHRPSSFECAGIRGDIFQHASPFVTDALAKVPSDTVNVRAIRSSADLGISSSVISNTLKHELSPPKKRIKVED